jgi:hypothetical protein
VNNKKTRNKKQKQKNKIIIYGGILTVSSQYFCNLEGKSPPTKQKKKKKKYKKQKQKNNKYITEK